MCFQAAGSLSADRSKENDHARIVDVVQPPPTSMTPTTADILLDDSCRFHVASLIEQCLLKKEFRP
jgi:hypothetical protein